MRWGAALAALWLAAALVCLLWAGWAARRGLQRAETAADRVTPEGIVVGRDLGLLRGARDDFDRARDLLRSPVLAPLRVLPVAGRQLRGAATLTAAAGDVLDAGVDAAETSRAELDAARRGGRERVAAMERLVTHAEAASERLAAVDLGSPSGLIGPLGRARARFAEQLPSLRTAVRELAEAGSGFATFLRGPHVYLVLATNNNEMRIGSGAPLSMGLLFTDGGKIALSNMYPAASFYVDRDIAPEMDPDQAELWGWTGPNREWRNLGVSPRFDATGELAARMIIASPKFPEEVDGVLALDPVALRAIVDATEPVATSAGPLEGDDLLLHLLIGQYLDAPDYSDEQIARREELSRIARAAVDRLDAGDWEPEVLVRELRRAAAGRHVLAWSDDPAEQRAWEVAGVSGEMDDDSLMVGLHNRGGNKLDPFVVTDMTMEAEPRGGGSDVTLRLEMANIAFEDLPQYIAGPYPQAVGAAEGVYQGIAVFQLPADATEIEVVRHDRPVVAEGRDGPNQVVGVQVKVPRGERRRVVVRFHVPARVESLRVEPSARVPAVSWHYAGEDWTDEQGRRVALP